MDPFEQMLFMGEDAIIEGIEILEDVLKNPKIEFPNRASIHCLLGQANFGIKNFERALFHHKKDLEIGRRNNYKDGETRALGNIAMVHVVQNNFDEACAAVSELQRITEILSEEYERQLMNCKAYFLHGMAHLEHAIRPLHTDSQLRAERGNDSRNSVGEQKVKNMEYYLQEAVSFFGKQREIAIEICSRKWENLAIGNLANAYYYLEEYEKAVNYYKQRLAIACDYEDSASQIITLKNLANAYVQMGKTDESSDCYQRALALTEKEQKSKSKLDEVHVTDEESDGYDLRDYDADTFITEQSFRAASQSSIAVSNSKKYKSTSDLHYAKSVKNGRPDNFKPKNGLSRSKTLSKIKERDMSCETFHTADPQMFKQRKESESLTRRQTFFGAPFDFIKDKFRRLSMNIN